MSMGTSKKNNSVARRRVVGKKLVCGVGINEADYGVESIINGKRVMCPAYSSWRSMLRRCYGAKYHHGDPAHTGVKVCDEWLRFMVFRKWWVENQVDGWRIDKDILSDDGIYSPDTCIFVPVWLSKFTANRGAARGEYPIGSWLCGGRGKFESRCQHPFGGRKFLGHFSTPEEAHAAWLACKLEIANELKHLMDDIDARIFPRVIEIISRSK